MATNHIGGPASCAYPTGQTHRIILVDADTRTGAMLCALLGDDGVAVEIHRDTHQVVAAVQQATIDLLILDVTVGPTGGFTLLSALRQMPCCPPVVVMSSHDARGARARAFTLGALDYITKPVAAVELRARVGVAFTGVCRVRSDMFSLI